uniref:Protein arginine methyltransferase NDUFAF7 n=1 Tax=Salvator merianae TaxID=96440 RepID=A0A8D0BT58_SALMN
MWLVQSGRYLFGTAARIVTRGDHFVRNHCNGRVAPNWIIQPNSALFKSWPTLLKCQCFSSESQAEENSLVTPMMKHLMMKIKSTGPITVAEYMQEVLTNPVMGYYMHHDMLGEKGDFVTSPEISQIFGELIGVWFVSEWIASGKPEKFQLVELGPGRGTLTEDILRVFSQLSSVLSKCDISVHLVEVSPKLSEIQASILTKEKTELSENHSAYMQGITKTGLPVFWYRDLNDVPVGNSFYLAHEFFDALPIHKFQKTQKGWREILVDIDPHAPERLRFVLAPSATPTGKAFIHDKESRDHVEVCPEAGIIMQKLALNIEKNGGAALIIDYGHDGTKTDTFRGFRRHKLHEVLISPGTADLTADVDFSYLRRMTQGRVATLGPIKQQEFLKNMGIDFRLQVLLKNVSDAVTRGQLLQSYEMLMDLDKMGGRFHFFAVLRQCRFAASDQRTTQNSSTTVAGFDELLLK